ncbi:hypothetical protein SH611_17670 [Geminicoccaceae bacterium 1502E]|nr:hypothetical protein [Geminicoccaceae bacterium 1502E]
MGVGSIAGWAWRCLAASETHLAYPLLVATGSPLSPADWRDVAQRWLADAGSSAQGIGVLTARGGVILGLFFYRCVPGVRQLDVPVLRAIELTGRARTTAALIEVLEGLAAELGCRRVVLAPSGDPAGAGELDDRLEAVGEELGLVREGRVWRREVAQVSREAGCRVPAGSTHRI